MKTYKTFVEQSNSARENLNELAPLAIGAMALNTVLRADGAYRTYKSIKKGDWVGAGLNALSVVNPLARKVAPLRVISPAAGVGAAVKDVVDDNTKKKKEKIKVPSIDEGNKLVNVRTNAGVTRGIDPSTGEYRVIKRRSDKEQEAMKNPKGFEMY